MEAEDAFSMPFIIFTLPIAFLLGVCIQLGIIPDFAITDTERRMKLIVIVLPVYFLCSYRYLYYPKIKKNNYEIFRKKWGNEPLSIRRRRKWLIIALFVILYRKNTGAITYKFISDKVEEAYDKFAPFSFKKIREKVKELGMEYSAKQYTTQIVLFAGGAFIISYLYFYNIIISIVYALVAILVIPYLSYLRCKRIYSEFIFEQIQAYTTNTIMEFATTQSFVKALEGVYSSNVLEDPILSDVKKMIDMSYENGTINEAIEYMNSKYDYHMVRNMHQLFLQVNQEGSLDSKDAMDAMLTDIDALVEGVYRDRIDRATFHKSFLQYGIMLYLLVMLIQYLLGNDAYLKLLDQVVVRLLLHSIIIINSYFLLKGEKYYNENVGAE